MNIIQLLNSLWKSRKGFEMSTQALLIVIGILILLVFIIGFVTSNSARINESSGVLTGILGMFKG